MATKIIHKKSSSASSVPVAGDLEPGELAINLADKKLYSKTVGGTVIELGNNPMSGAAIKSAYEGETNAYTDALNTKLGNIETLADVTDTTNVTAAGAAMLGGAGMTVGSTHFNVQTGTSYTLVAGDNGKTVTMNNASASTLTVPAGLGAGFRVTILQIGAGQVTITASGVTLNSLSGFIKVAGQHGVAGLLANIANTFALAGDLVA